MITLIAESSPTKFVAAGAAARGPGRHGGAGWARGRRRS
jgi:hypothetical protein